MSLLTTIFSNRGKFAFGVAGSFHRHCQMSGKCHQTLLSQLKKMKMSGERGAVQFIFFFLHRLAQPCDATLQCGSDVRSASLFWKHEHESCSTCRDLTSSSYQTSSSGQETACFMHIPHGTAGSAGSAPAARDRHLPACPHRRALLPFHQAPHRVNGIRPWHSNCAAKTRVCLCVCVCVQR